jgi:hypothetical protein
MECEEVLAPMPILPGQEVLDSIDAHLGAAVLFSEDYWSVLLQLDQSSNMNVTN